MEKEIKTIYEDENILVINKPSGLVVNRSNTNKGVTLQDVLDDKHPLIGEKDDSWEDSEEFLDRTGIVHRLDKDTSGVLVIAKNPDIFRFLQKQFKERSIYKEYAAIVHGRVENDLIEIDAPLGRSPRNPLKTAVVSSGKHALTKAEKVKEIEIKTEYGTQRYTLLKVFPKTGRTHQIRIHLASIGHPIAGDVMYCSNNLLEMDSKLFGRLMLHASFLGFINPKTNNFQRFESPLPKAFLL